MSPTKNPQEPSLEGLEPLLQFKFPEMEDKEVYAIKLPDGRIIFRGKDEIEKKEGKGK